MLLYSCFFTLAVSFSLTSFTRDIPPIFSDTVFAAADDPYLLKETAEHAGVKQPYTPSTLPSYIGSLIRTVLAFIGVVFFVLVVYAGFKWMTARGKEETTSEAKSTMENALIGLIIISGAYALTTFIIERVWK